MIHAFYSDPHFGHKQIIGYCERPFSDVYSQTHELIKRYNAVVEPHHFVLWVGDCFLSLSQYEERSIMDRLNGAKGCIIGNHDKSASRLLRAGFDWVAPEVRMFVGGRRVLVSHYPYANTKRRGDIVDTRYPDRRPKRIKGEVLIHGHTHSTRRRDGNQIHVGVDAWDYAPAPYAEVETLIAEV